LPCGAGGKDVAVPKPYPEEFRQDVGRVARNRGLGVTVEQVAVDFGVHAMTLSKWMRRADIDGAKPGTTSQDSAELREARRRIKLLEQENEVLRRAAAYLSQAHLPGKSSTRS
jgi:transposase-like protein